MRETVLNIQPTSRIVNQPINEQTRRPTDQPKIYKGTSLQKRTEQTNRGVSEDVDQCKQEKKDLQSYSDTGKCNAAAVAFRNYSDWNGLIRNF